MNGSRPDRPCDDCPLTQAKALRKERLHSVWEIICPGCSTVYESHTGHVVCPLCKIEIRIDWSESSVPQGSHHVSTVSSQNLSAFAQHVPKDVAP